MVNGLTAVLAMISKTVSLIIPATSSATVRLSLPARQLVQKETVKRVTGNTAPTSPRTIALMSRRTVKIHARMDVSNVTI